MLSGIHPLDLGIRDLTATIPYHTPLAAELLKEVGYQTAAFVDSKPKGMVGADRGFSRGFDQFHHAPHRPNLQFKFEMAATLEAAEQWLKRRDEGRPFFLFLHTMSAHGVAEGQGDDPRKFPL